MVRNVSEPQYDATRTSDTEILHFRDKEEGDGGRGKERPERLSDLQHPIHEPLYDQGKKKKTCGSGPLAQTEEAHGLIEGLDERLGKSVVGG